MSANGNGKMGRPRTAPPCPVCGSANTASLRSGVLKRGQAEIASHRRKCYRCCDCKTKFEERVVTIVPPLDRQWVFGVTMGEVQVWDMGGDDG